MWTRKELKTRGKASFKRNYWRSVVAGLVVLFATGATSGVSGSAKFEEVMANINAALNQTSLSPTMFFGILLGLFGVATLISVAIGVFLRNPLEVGADCFFLKNSREPAELNDIFSVFKSRNYIKIVGAKFLASLFIALWSLLLVIPGIIKSLEYLMVGYILAEDSEIGITDALRKSKQMMKGHKWNAFVLVLSFLGWEFLSVLTLGFLDIFYVRPYIEATFAELYLKLAKQ